MKRKFVPLALALLFWAGIVPAADRAPIVPDSDPEKSGPPLQLNSDIAGKHPRLFITADQIPKLKEFYESDKAKLYREQLEYVAYNAAVPENRQTDKNWGQQVGIFDMPSVALHYVLTGDKASFNVAMSFLKWLSTQPDWTIGGAADMPFDAALNTLKKWTPQGEVNTDTTASFTMVGAALTWDWLYNDMDPEFREQFRQVLWQHARLMYYGGIMGGDASGHDWRLAPSNNLHWYHDWGLALATLAATDGKPQEQWLLGKVNDELQLMANWLPPDGSDHEGVSHGTSAGALGLALLASDECLGSRYMDLPYFHHLGEYALNLTAPGMKEVLFFGDCFSKTRSFHAFYLYPAAKGRQADVLDGFRHMIQLKPNAFGVREMAWFTLIAEDPDVEGGSYKKLPTTSIYPDLGLAIMRDNWEDNAVAAMFKCSIPGGYALDAWRSSVNAVSGTWPTVNVWHDHPDANSFVILGDGEYLAETDRFPWVPGKLTSSVNSVLVNGMGQNVPGQSEGDVYTSPSKESMAGMGKITAWTDTGSVVAVQGEAAGSYPAYDNHHGKKRPALDRFRRTFIWVKGGYILVLDDLRAPESVEFTWLMQGAQLTAVDADNGKYRLSKGAAQCDFQLLSDMPLKSKLGISTANDCKKMMNWQQLQASVTVPAVRFVGIFNPWHHKDLKMTLALLGPHLSTITVTGEGINDTWNWTTAGEQSVGATITGNRKGGFDVLIDGKAAPPPAVPLPRAE